MGIRSLLVPLAYVISAALRKSKVSIWSIVSFSFLVIFFTIFSFYMVFASPFYIGRFELITIAGIFLIGFLDEVLRELSRKKKLPALPLALARHSDLILVFGILYVFMAQPYTPFTSFNVDDAIFPAIGILMFFGVLVADFMGRKMEKRDPGLESRAERMFLLTAFLLLGLYFNEFLLAIFVGLIGVTVSLYLWIFWTKSRIVYDLSESLYRGLLNLWRSVSATGSTLKISRKLKIPAKVEVEKEEDFEEYGVEDHASNSGYNFTVVVNDRRSEPVSNVKVSLLNVETGDDYTGHTDPSGRASFVGVTEGQYKIILACEGYKDTEFTRYVSMDSGEVFVLKRPFSDLSIVISDKERTTPVPNAEVFLRPQGNNAAPMTRSADNLGVAYFDELDVMAYEIYVKAKGYLDWKRSINLDEENVISVTLEQGKARTEPVKTEPKKHEIKEEIKVPREEVEFSEILNDSVLLEYSSPEDVHAVVSQMATEYKKHDRDVFFVSAPDRAEGYKDLAVEIIELPDLDEFKNVLDRMPAGSVLIIEALSDIIQTYGFGPAFKFVSKTLEYTEREGLLLACFLNPSAHDENEVEKLRGILKSVVIEEGRLYR